MAGVHARHGSDIFANTSRDLNLRELVLACVE
jgi:hypothetical protein